jgi:hypothetical protein
MYHAIVKQIARKNFERVNQKDFDALVKDCAPGVHHRFYGSHALSGERHDRGAVRRWFERLERLAPGLTITVHDIWVKGLPMTPRSLCDGPQKIPASPGHLTGIMAYTSSRCAGSRSSISTRMRIPRL